MKLSFLVMAFLFFGVNAQAQTADEVINRHANAIGGKKNLDEIRSLKYTGTAKVDSNKLDYSLLIVKDTVYLNEVTFSGMSIVICLEDTTGWEINPLEGITEPKPMDNSVFNRYKLLTRSPDELVNYKAYNYKLGGMEKKKDAGKDYYAITILRDGQSKITHYINAETYLLHKTVEKVKENESEFDRTVIVKDFQTTDGVKLPSAVDVLKNGVMEYALTNTIRANVKVNDSRLKKEY